MAFLLGLRPSLQSETWKQVFQKYEKSIPNSLRRTIQDKCKEIEEKVDFWLYYDRVPRELESKYKKLGTKLLGSKDTPDWENVSENLSQMYEDYLRKWMDTPDSENASENLCKMYDGYRTWTDVGHSFQDDVEPKQFVVQSSQEEEDLHRKIQIKVKTLHGVKHVLKNVTIHDSVVDLKGKIAAKVGCMSEEEVILLYNRNELCDGYILDTYGIASGATINMLPRVPGKGLIESAKKILTDARNVMKYLGKWIPELLVETSRKVTEIELSKIVPAIGENWELLGIALGLDSVQLQHISADNSTMKMKIYSMLTTWLDLNQSSATFKKLYETMKECRYRNTVRFNWEKVKRIFAGV